MIAALIAAMMLVESGGDPNAVGDGGHALGVLQIHACVVQDVNRIYGTTCRHSDALDPAWAKEICRLCLMRYAGPGASPEKMARIWNGGPRGHLKPSTHKYWQKVREKLCPGKSQTRN